MQIKLGLPSSFLVIALMMLFSPALSREPFTIDDGLRMKSVGDVAIAPDGSAVFYSIESLDWSENKRKKEYFLSSADGSSTRKFIGDAGGENFRFSPDGKYLAFLRAVDSDDEDEEPNRQLFMMPTDGGEASGLSDHKGKITDFKWSSDSSAIIFVAEETLDEEEEKEIKLGADAVFVDEAPNGKESARFTNFWRLTIADKESSRLTNEKLVIEGFDPAPDGERIAFVARPDTRTNYVHEAELYLYREGARSVKQLTDNAAPESDPLWSPDGSNLAYRAPSAETFELRAGYFWVMDPETGEARRLEGQNTGETVGAKAWTADGSKLLYNEIHGTNTNLYELNVESGAARALTSVSGTLRAHAFSADRNLMAYIFQDFTTPPDLYVSDLTQSAQVRITDANPWIREDRTLSDGELMQWSGKDGMTIEGVFYPRAKKRSGKAPMILNIHGGPAGVIENAFREDFQILANAGYAILAPNPRGSTGGGDDLLRGLMGEVGDGEYIDLMNGVDYAIANKNIDADKLGVRGWSWGGVSTSYTITQTQRFKAASVGAMVGNWAAETGPGFNFDVSLWYIGGTPWDNPDEWAKRSSITHVKNITTPSIIFHGGEDRTSSTGQALMFFTAMRDIGKAPVRYIEFPRQGHGIREPRLSRIYQMNELQWFKKYIDGRNWKIPAASFADDDE